MDRTLSQHDINNIAGFHSRVITYPELANYNNIYDVFGDDDSFILLYQTSDNYGHWCCVFIRPDGNLEFFDSYGNEPDEKIRLMGEYFRESGNYLFPNLTYLFLKSGKDIHYNNYKLQKYGAHITTCGRWVGERLRLKDYSIDEFKNYIDSYRVKDLDRLITKITNKYLN